jgi:hypothetical protein
MVKLRQLPGIGLNAERILAQLRYGLFELLLSASGDEDECAFVNEFLRGTEADTFASARDQCDLSR